MTLDIENEGAFRIQLTIPRDARGRPLDVTLKEIRENFEGVVRDPQMHTDLAKWLAGEAQ